VFISWSGARSNAAAQALRDWLPMVINALNPWLSSADIHQGARWQTDVAANLENAGAGIICLTPSNLHSDWILFEAGALSKAIKDMFVCPLLIGLEPTDIELPLAQFQVTQATREDLLKLLKTLNKAMGENALKDTHVEVAFAKWWPELESKLVALPPDELTPKTRRTERDILEELLALARSVARDRFGSEGEVVKKLMQEAGTSEFQVFKRLIQDKSEVAQMIEKSAAEQAEVTKRIFREIRDLKLPPEEK